MTNKNKQSGHVTLTTGLGVVGDDTREPVVIVSASAAIVRASNICSSMDKVNTHLKPYIVPSPQSV